MKANRFAKNDEGVSAVIGVILMVAITVILAAVIAAFVFGMVGGVKKTYNVAATASRAGGVVTVTYNGGPDNDQIHATAGAADGVSVTVTDDTTGLTIATDSPASVDINQVGSSLTYTAPNKAHVVVVAKFADNSQQVICDSHV